MRSGRLNHIIQLQANQTQVDPRSGQKVEQWVTFAQVWAAIEPLKGQALFVAQQMNSEITVKIIFRWHAEIIRQLNHSMRVHYHGVNYALLHDPIDPELRHREIHLMCKVVSA